MKIFYYFEGASDPVLWKLKVDLAPNMTAEAP